MVTASVTVSGFSDVGTGERDYGRGVIRISEAALQLSPFSELNLKRHSLIRVSRDEKVLYAIFRPLISDNPNLVCLEYDDRLQLGIDKKHQKVDLNFSKAGAISGLMFYWDHADPLLRINFRLSIFIAGVSLLLGILISELPVIFS